MEYKVLNNIEHEIIIRKSRFIINLIIVNNELDVKNELKKIKLKHKHSNHNCYAYIIDNIKRFNDDGEPSGTAGIPILEILEKNKLNFVLCIITRYFGGIKLGSSGLIRAYSKGAVEVLNNAKIVPIIECTLLSITFNYEYVNKIDNILKNLVITNKKFEGKINYIVEVPLANLSNIKNKLQSISSLEITEQKNK